MARLVDEKKLGWDTLVKDVLPDFKHSNPIITEVLTIADILSHRCGLAGSGTMSLSFQGDGEMLLPRDSLFDLINQFPILFPIRQSWDYFVWGYSLAGEIIERVTGKTLEEYVSTSLTGPLGMKDTSFKLSRLDPERLAQPYAALSDGTSHHLQHRQVFEGTFFEASGGLFSTVNDLITWATATLDAIDGEESGVLKEIPNIISNHAAIMNPSIRERSYGFGWARTQLPGSVGVIGDNFSLWSLKDQPALGDKDHPLLMLYHQGSTVGYYAHIALFPDTKSAVVVLSNSIALTDAPDWISRATIQTLFDLKDGHDYALLAAEANSRQMAEYDTLARQIAKKRESCSDAVKPPPLEALVGRYASKSKPFFIDILLGSPESGDKTLELRFQGLQIESYELRYLCENTFEWSLSHDESKKRGRYNMAELEYFLFEFTLKDGKPISFTWVTDPGLPEHPEEFFLVAPEGGGSQGPTSEELKK
ncbi:beta-lactamase/transpeptidase-like protein [Cercophora newfieldiana]|uniref:Beta-lactamase/transpeptidase-like protein n=1 Tax=Cercophora newfieldiana TaxID=92897 RepID=A0AA39Y6I4_9PEZI|nr:beta-lactamase/transpeptidase-like protein [Cercophora newfieldiana]